MRAGRAFAAADDAARLSRARFDFGADSFLQLLDADRTRAEAAAALADRAVRWRMPGRAVPRARRRLAAGARTPRRWRCRSRPKR
jgi:hypothetical protein